MATPRRTPRGIRNNNPLNIRIGNTWLGETPFSTDSDFEQFVHIKYGLRAAFCILRRYIRKYNRNTIRKIICAWAPATENNTSSYITKVADRIGISPDSQLAYEDRDIMCRLVAAMAEVECGQKIDMEDIIEGYKLA